MKSSASSDKKFSPVHLSLTFETQGELDKFYHLFDNLAIINSLEIDDMADSIRKPLGDYIVDKCSNNIMNDFMDKLSKNYHILKRLPKG